MKIQIEEYRDGIVTVYTTATIDPDLPVDIQAKAAMFDAGFRKHPLHKYTVQRVNGDLITKILEF